MKLGKLVLCPLFWNNHAPTDAHLSISVFHETKLSAKYAKTLVMQQAGQNTKH